MSLLQFKFFQKSATFLFLLGFALGQIQGQVPVPNRENTSNPYSGNPTRESGDESEQAAEDLKDSVVTQRIFSDRFGTGLPSFFREGEWRLRLNPKFGDFFEEDHIRFPIGVEYSFSNHFEGIVDVGTYFSNPFGSGGGSGTYNLRVGGKYSWWNAFNSPYNMSLGFNSDMPWSRPPLDITDGWARHEPFIAFSREIGRDPDILAYVNVAYEMVSASPFKSVPVSPRPRNRMFLRPGFIYYPGGNYRYSTELEYRTNAFDNRSPNPVDYVDWIGTREYTRAFRETHEVFISPGITWFPTEEFREGFFVPGNWDIGLKVEIPIVDETDEDFSVSLRFRWYYDYEDYLKTKFKNLWPLGKNDEK